MTTEGHADNADRARVRDVPGLVLAGLALRRFYRRQTSDDADAGVFMLNDRSMLICDRAMAFAAAGREDRAAVDELGRLPRGKARDLKVATISFRQFGTYEEDWVANRAYRLLRAAAGPFAVEEVPSELAVRLDCFERLDLLPLEERFARLEALEPRLGGLEAQARAGQLGRFEPVSNAVTEHDMDRILAAQAVTEALQRRLGPLVGPQAEHDHFLLRSQRGHQWASMHLRHLMGGSR